MYKFDIKKVNPNKKKVQDEYKNNDRNQSVTKVYNDSQTLYDESFRTPIFKSKFKCKPFQSWGH